MNLPEIVNRAPVPEPWAEGEKIPWDDPAFSARMLAEHLSQAHDAASRRFVVIDRHVRWIDDALLDRTPAHILDLGCGPGFYTSRLARLGHICTGIDFGPASVAYARYEAARDHLACAYVEADLRAAEFRSESGLPFDLAMLIFGEFNVFSPADARRILHKAHAALRKSPERGGILLLEPHTFAAVRALGKRPATWYSAQRGLFSDRPHICLQENFWDESRAVATTRYFIVDAETGETTRHAASIQAYTDEQYRSLLHECGFRSIRRFPSLSGTEDAAQSDFFVLVAAAVEREGGSHVRP